MYIPKSYKPRPTITKNLEEITGIAIINKKRPRKKIHFLKYDYKRRMNRISMNKAREMLRLRCESKEITDIIGLNSSFISGIRYRDSLNIGSNAIRLPGKETKLSNRDLNRLKEFISTNDMYCTPLKLIKQTFESDFSNRLIRDKSIILSTYRNWITSKAGLNLS
jgi:hypothetical protein